MTLREAGGFSESASALHLLALGPEVEQLELLDVRLADAGLVVFDVVRDTGSHRPLSSTELVLELDVGVVAISTDFGATSTETTALAGSWCDVLDAAGTSAPLGFAPRGARRFRVDEALQASTLPAWSGASAPALVSVSRREDVHSQLERGLLSVPRERPRSSGRACVALTRGAVGSPQRGRTGSV